MLETKDLIATFLERLERFELPTPTFVALRSGPLSYKRITINRQQIADNLLIYCLIGTNIPININVAKLSTIVFF